MEGASPVPGQGRGKLQHRATSASSIHVPYAPVQGIFGVHLSVFPQKTNYKALYRIQYQCCAICCTPNSKKMASQHCSSCQPLFQKCHNWRSCIDNFSNTTEMATHTWTPNLLILNLVQPDSRLCPNPSSIPVMSWSQPEVATCKQGGWHGNARTEGRGKLGSM